MLHLSCNVAYAIRALVCLERSRGRFMLIRQVAAVSGVPAASLAKVVKKLGDAGLVVSKRGCGGGTRLTRPCSQVSLLAIRRAVEGGAVRLSCLLGMGPCSEKRKCPAHEFWAALQADLEADLGKISIADCAKLYPSAKPAK